jgi:hypothetical protein
MSKIKVVIDRAKWRCGGEEGCSFSRGAGLVALRNEDGYQCCLGFVTAAVKPELCILNIGHPRILCTDVPELVERRGNLFVETSLTAQAIAINDNRFSSDEKRERQLLELFKDSPYELEFVGEYNERQDQSDD